MHKYEVLCNFSIVLAEKCTRQGTSYKLHSYNGKILPMIKPEALRKGDTVATISPSWGCAGSSRVRWEYELGYERLRDLGLEVIAAPNSLKGTTYLRNNPEARADDINWAFENKNVKAVIANIGGNDADRLFPYISKTSIINNPKILCGYSDVMSLHLFCRRLGLMTYYGDNLLTNIAENPMWHPYSRHWFEKTFFDTSVIGTVGQSEDWSYDDSKHTDRDYRKKYVKDKGRFPVQGKGTVRGKLFGGHGDLLKFMEPENGALVTREDLEGSIFFFEDIPECCSPEGMADFFDFLGQKGYLQLIKGIIIGKMRSKRSFEPYAQKIREVITDKYDLKDLPVLGNMNFGHTSPVFIIPYGAEAELSMDDMSFAILESGVSRITK